ncbi:hypothetical protein MMC25_004548 [Agyrium rufum]|nr:hypothetical protein [Agyrium rufum]
MVGIPQHKTLAKVDLFDVLCLNPNKPETIMVAAIKSAYNRATLVLHPDKRDANSYEVRFPDFNLATNVRNFLLAEDDDPDRSRDAEGRIVEALAYAHGFRSTWNSKARNTPGRILRGAMMQARRKVGPGILTVVIQSPGEGTPQTMAVLNPPEINRIANMNRGLAANTLARDLHQGIPTHLARNPALHRESVPVTISSQNMTTLPCS